MNSERLKECIAIIEAIPANRLDLDSWQKSTGPFPVFADRLQNTHCGTIACAAGWLALYPQMQAHGLLVSYRGRPVFTHNQQIFYGTDALARFLDIRDVEADRLFTHRRQFEKCEPFKEMSDKELWLYRARQLLASHETTP